MKSDPNPSKNQETLESVKEKFSTKLTDILYERLTVDNIENFADVALDKIIYLNSTILEYYKNSGKLEIHPELELKDQEDDAYTQLGLPKVSNILDLIEEKKNEIDKIKDKIKKEYIDTVITPPQENDGGIIPGGEKGFEKKKLLPRILTLMYILENDLEVDLNKVKIIEGKVRDNMMRQTPYVRVEIDDLERLVYICDEEGNASYIFDTEKMNDKRISPEDLDIDNKGDKNSLIQMHPGIGVRVVQTKNWRDKVKGYLENEIPEVDVAKNMLGEVEEFEGEKIQSEFKKREKKLYLPYNVWIEELKDAYEKDKNVVTNFNKWYRKKSEEKKGWCKSLSGATSVLGKSYQEIFDYVGFVKKTKKQETYIPYNLFINELKTAFDEHKGDIMNIDIWYNSELKKHNRWYSSLMNSCRSYNKTRQQIYEEIGYTPKNEIQESYLPYEEWIKQLKTLVEKEKGSILRFDTWYSNQAVNRTGWYRSISNLKKNYNKTMHEIYEKIGYKPNIEIQETYLEYKDFIIQLKDIYTKSTESVANFQNWYSKEAKKHKGWYRNLQNLKSGYGKSTLDVYKAIGRKK